MSSDSSDFFSDPADEQPAPSIPTITPTVVESSGALALDGQLTRIIKDAKLEPDSEKLVLTTFSPLMLRVQEWSVKVDSLIPQGREPTKSEHKVISDTRKTLTKLRTSAEKERKRLKADALSFGKTVDSANNRLLELVEPLEEKLRAAEEYAERQEAARKAELLATRTAELTALNVVPTLYNLAEMPEDVYNGLLASSKTAFENAKIAAKKAEEDRIAREKAEAEERERIRQDNERLRREAVERERVAAEERAKAEKERKEAEEIARKQREEIEAKARAEREAAEAVLAAERAKAEAARKIAEEQARKERERIAAENAKKLAAEREQARKIQEAAAAALAAERKKAEDAAAEAKRLQEAEAARLAQIEAEKAALLAAPDREKVLIFAESIKALPIPHLTTPKGAALQVLITQQTEKFVAWLVKEAGKL